jgi:uncharacterized protein involved in outer membrane biogenesis
MTRGTRALTGLAVVSAAAGAALFVEFDAPRVGRAALARIGAALDARISASAFRFQPSRGLALEGLAASSDFPGGRWSLEAEALVLDHRFWPLLSGRVEVDRIVVRRPHVRLEQGAPGPAEPRVLAAPAVAALALRVASARVEDGTVEFVAAGQPPLTIAGLEVSLTDIAMAGPTLAALSARGSASAEAIRFARTEAREAGGRLRVDSGALVFDEIRFRTAEGRFQASLTARIDRLPLAYSLDLRGDPLDLNALAGRADGGFGPATLELAASGEGAGAAALRGRGVLRMRPGRLPASPLMEGLQAALGTTLVGTRYEASQTPFRLQDGRASFDSFRLSAPPLTIEMRGWIALDGPLSLAVQVRAPRSAVRIAGVSAEALDVLADDEGRIAVPLTVRGTQASPVVRPDTGALLAQAGRGLGRSAIEKAARGLEGLLRKR